MSADTSPGRSRKRRPRPGLRKEDARPLDFLIWLVCDIRNTGTAILLVFGLGVAVSVPLVAIGLVLNRGSTLAQIALSSTGTFVVGAAGLAVRKASARRRERRAEMTVKPDR
jgi:hypothetical protein